MVDYRSWIRVLGEALREFRYLLVAEVEKFTVELENWVNHLVTRPLPREWRRQTAVLLLHWERQGLALSPQSVEILEWWIEAWAARRGFLPKEDGERAADTGENDPPHVQLADDTAVRAPTKPPDRPSPPSKYWPLLTPEEAEAAQKSTTLPWWYPFQPRNRMDELWARRLADFGRGGRDRLLEFFQETAALGRAARAIKPSEDFDPQPLLDQHAKVQAAYDRYLEARVAVYQEWTRYLEQEWFIGPEVRKVFEKINDALPSRVEGVGSPVAAKLQAARRAGEEAVERKRRRTEQAYTALVWTDRVITAIEVATLVGSAKTVMKKTFEKAIAKGLSQTAAHNVTIAYGIAHLATAAASAAAVGQVLPPILAAAGLDEEEVNAGLAIFRTVFTLVGLRSITRSNLAGKMRARPEGSGSVRLPPRLQRKTKPPIGEARRQAGNAFNRAQASKYPYNEIRIVRPDGGRPYVLDSYDPGKREIVFRRNTQFSEITVNSAKAYIKEFVTKYPPGRMIARVPSSKDLGGQPLSGTMIFEVPPQWKKIPLTILEEATRQKVRIRDSNGKFYN